LRIVWLRAAERNLEEQLEYLGRATHLPPTDLPTKSRLPSRASQIIRTAAALGVSREPAS
jgi:hypothetical protein